MDDPRGHKRVGAAGILLLLTVLLGVLLAVPAIRHAPLLDAPVEAPATAP